MSTSSRARAGAPDETSPWVWVPGVGPEAGEALTPAGLEALVEALVSRRAQLARMPAGAAIRAVDLALRRLEDPGDPRRLRLEAALPEGVSLQMWRWGLETTLKVWSAAGLERWLHRDLGGAPLGSWHTREPGLRRMALPPRLLFHVQAGNVGAPGLEGIVAAALLGAPTLCKLPSLDDGLSLALAELLVEVEPALAGAFALARWRGGHRPLEQAAMGAAEVLLFHGADAALADLQARTPPGLRVVAHAHRLSCAYVGQTAADSCPDDDIDALLMDCFAYEQLGCLSPRVVFVQGGTQRAVRWAERLAARAPAVCEALPPPPLEASVAVQTLQARGRYGFGPLLVEGQGWTVAVSQGQLLPSPPCRFVLVAPCVSPPEAVSQLGEVASRLQGLSVLAEGPERDTIASPFIEVGVSWVARAGQLQRPPAGWPADGRPLLGDLVRWVDASA